MKGKGPFTEIRVPSGYRKSVLEAPSSTLTKQRKGAKNIKCLQVLLTSGSPLTGVGFKLRVIMKSSRRPLVGSAPKKVMADPCSTPTSQLNASR